MTRNRPRREVTTTQEDRAIAQRRIRRATRGVMPMSLVLQALSQLAAGFVVTKVWGHQGMALVVSTSLVTVAMLTPLVYAITRVASRKSLDQIADSMAKERVMRAEVARREFETRLANALEMAEAEPEAMSAASRALRVIAPDRRIEVLLADNSHAHLERALVTHADHEDVGCTVESPDRCVAARRGQTQVFADSDDLDACPKLQGRPYGRCSAVCVPVSIMGRTVGVVHLAEPLSEAAEEPPVEQLEVLANQIGARIGMIRVMSESQVQASTDSLTGLPNRRSFEAHVRQLRSDGTPFALIMADLDNFKRLNDTYGHEAGDRALRVFSGVVRDSLRAIDFATRYGGEEFTIVLPECTTDEAIAVCERLRESLALATQTGSAPDFTASYGIAPSDGSTAPEDLLGRADLALYEAKRNGRNRAVVYESAKAYGRDATQPAEGLSVTLPERWMARSSVPR